MFAAEIRKRRIYHRSYSQWRWHLDEVFARINGATHYLWRAVDHEGEVLEVFATKCRHRKTALEVSETNDEMLRPAVVDRDGPSSLIRCGDESDQKSGVSGMWAMAQEPGQKLTPAIPAARGFDGQVQGYQDPAEIRSRSHLHSQPF